MAGVRDATAPGSRCAQTADDWGLSPGQGGIKPFDRASAHNLAFWDELAGRGTRAG